MVKANDFAKKTKRIANMKTYEDYLKETDKYFDYWEDKPAVKPKRNKEQEQLKLVALLLVGGLVYYLMVYLPNEREETKRKLNNLFENNYPVTSESLDNSLWKKQKSWEKHLEKLYFSWQIAKFEDNMQEAIETAKKKWEEGKFTNKKEACESAMIAIKNSCTPKELEMPTFKKIITKYSKKINNSSLNDISTLQKEANELIIQERIKNQGLHWRKESQKTSWADKWLNDNVQTFEQAWSKMSDIMKKEPEYFNIAASYKIKFPPSLWNSLTEKQKKHKKAEELKLGDDVPTYKFSELITKWEEKVKMNPTRGKKDSISKLDNNALFYGAPRTGKSVMSEKIAYEADRYPLVVIQGSSLTPRDLDYKAGIDPLGKFIFSLCDIDYTLEDIFGFEREDNNEVRYILFIDEANQITTSTLISKSTELTFLKECMGSDTRINESQNLWIAATNHLHEINPAVYQPGRLSNPLDFSWTLGDFINYTREPVEDNKTGEIIHEEIYSKFPEHWLNTQTLSNEDNKWVNRFNKMYYDNDFLPFWDKFIVANPNAEYEPEKDDENQEESENNEKNKIKIKLGEMFEFFWNLFDSKQLEHFQGKYIPSRKPKIEDVVAKGLNLAVSQISKAIEELKTTSGEKRAELIAVIEDGIEQIKLTISEK